MDKSCHSSEDSTTNNSGNSGTTTTTTTRDHYLKHLNKLSHKISKPTVKKPSFDNPLDQNHNFRPPPPPPPPQSQQTQQQHQHQPPVYNINKNDFRDVVQKLTGSPAHERFSTPPPIHPPKPQSSRLQRIRPPPLAHVSNRPPPMLTGAAPPPFPNPNALMNPNHPVGGGGSGPAPNFSSFGRSVAPLSPLPPLPSVHAAAESPVSAYMRFLHNSASNLDPNPKQFSGFSPLAPLVSPRWNNQAPPLPPPPPQQQFQPPPPLQQGMLPPQSQPQYQLPSSPLPFGCMNSPRSPYPLLSPGVLFSPTSGFPQFPLSPRVPVSSPRWRDL